MSSPSPIAESPPITTKASQTEQSFHDGFKLSSNGTSASKTFKINLEDGTQKTYTFTVTFTASTKTDEAKKNILAKYDTQKITLLGNHALTLGLGQKFSSIKMNFNAKNELTGLEGNRKEAKTNRRNTVLIDDSYLQKKIDKNKRITPRTPEVDKKLEDLNNKLNSLKHIHTIFGSTIKSKDGLENHVVNINPETKSNQRKKLKKNKTPSNSLTDTQGSSSPKVTTPTTTTTPASNAQTNKANASNQAPPPPYTAPANPTATPPSNAQTNKTNASNQAPPPSYNAPDNPTTTPKSTTPTTPPAQEEEEYEEDV